MDLLQTFILTGAYALILLFSMILLVESLALWALQWENYLACLRDALIINVASVLLGFVELSLIRNTGLAGALVAFVTAILIEGVLLSLLRNKPRRLAWLAALVINTVSFLLLIGAMVAIGMIGGRLGA